MSHIGISCFFNWVVVNIDNSVEIACNVIGYIIQLLEVKFFCLQVNKSMSETMEAELQTATSSFEVYSIISIPRVG